MPKNAIYIIETEDPIQVWKKVKNNPLWEHLITQKTFKEISSGITIIDDMMTSNSFLFELLGKRKLMISAHMYKHNDYDFLYLIDLQNKFTTPFIEDILKKTINKNEYQVTSRAYKNHQIIEFYEKSTKERSYLSVFENIFIFSDQHRLVEKSLDEYESPTIGRDINFINITEKIKDSEYFNIYLNYTHLPEFIFTFLNQDDEIISKISKSLYYTGASYNLDDFGNISFKGQTLLNDTLNTFLRAVNNSGKSENKVAKVLPDITAFYLNLGFDNFTKFIQNIEKTLKNESETAYQEYIDSNKKIEKFLGISIAENFYSWIGDEVTYLQLQSGGLGTKNEFAFLLKIDSKIKANQNLTLLKKQIKKNTPGKFKSVEYRNHEINYFAIKGFFKAIMGNFLSKLERPYYAIIDDYIVFSNHPQTIRIIIDRYEDGKVLNKNEDYNQFINQFPKLNNVICYVNTNKIFANLLELSTQETQQNILKNKPYITCFDQIAFQLKSDGNYFETNFASTFKNPKNIKIEENLNFKSLNHLNFNIENTKDNTKDIFETLPIKLSDFDIKKYEDFFDDGTLKVEVSVKNGIKNGVYKQYYNNGELMLKGNFSNNQKHGTWKFYSHEGKLIEKRQYNNGEIVD